MTSLARYHESVATAQPLRRRGRVRRVTGLTIAASGPVAPLGELCRIGGRIDAIVTGFRDGELVLQPLGRVEGLRPGDPVEALGRGLEIPVGPGLIGRVIDGVGRPLDGKGPIPGRARRSLSGEPPPALSRAPIASILDTGVRAIDGCLTFGLGQRIGIFAGPGMGKSILLGELTRHASCDVCVLALVGERGREVQEFVHRVLGPEGLKRAVVIAATSDRPAVERLAAAQAAHAVAEHFRDAGLKVLLMLDSITRFCQAQREIGLASGEPPTARGYPPSAFAMLAPLLERAGTAASGSISAVYTVLVEGDPEEDPVADNVRAILDGHIVLARSLADRAIYPAIDLGRSVSRVAQDIASPADFKLALRARELWGEFERVRDLVEIGAYQRGADPRVDAAIAANPRLLDFLRQPPGQPCKRAETLERLRQAIGDAA